jgi:hypothetical protein
MLNRRYRLVLAFAVLTAGSAGVGLADDTRKPADPALDDELLEFLGSVDPASDAVPDDGSWIDYLSQTDISKVAKPGNPTVIAAKPATPAPKPSTPAPGAKQDE